MTDPQRSYIESIICEKFVSGFPIAYTAARFDTFKVWKGKKNTMRRLATLMLGLGALGMAAFAAPVLDFQGGAAGSGTITGNATTATGTSILIDTLLSNSQTPLHPSTSSGITGGTLQFSASGGSYNAGTGVYSYTGGTFSITGTDATASASGTLITGTLTKLSVDLAGAITLLSGPNTINANLLSYYGLPATGTGVVTNGTVHLDNVTGGSGGAYSATTFSTDIPDTVVPEPTSVLLLGTVMFGVAHLIRRRGMKV